MGTMSDSTSPTLDTMSATSPALYAMSDSTPSEALYSSQALEEVTTPGDYAYDEEGYPLYGKVLAGILIGLMNVAILVGNTLTIVSFYQDRRLRTVANYYILNLAVTDLLVGLTSVPFYAPFTLMDYHWPFGYTFCKVYNVVDFLVCAESAWAICLISYDRLEMVRRGAQYSSYSTGRRAAVLIPLSWIFSFLLYGPAIIGFDIWRGHSTLDPYYCDVEFATDFLYTRITAILEFLLPFVMVTTCSVLLYWNIRKRSRGDGVGGQSKERVQAMKRDRRALKNLSLLVSVFLVCWMPYTVATIILAFCGECVDEDLYEFLVWLLWGNSSLNALLYAYTNHRFRDNYRRILLALCCRKPQPAAAMNYSTSGPDRSTSGVTETTQ